MRYLIILLFLASCQKYKEACVDGEYYSGYGDEVLTLKTDLYGKTIKCKSQRTQNENR
jgi:hypothetical protein